MEDLDRQFGYENTIHQALDIRAVEFTADRVILEAEVNAKLHQPFGILHGGASAVMAESAASVGAWLNCDQAKEYVVGTDLNISHLRPKRSGRIRAVATPIRKGKTMHVWGIEITDEDGKAVAVARCTLAVRPLPEG